MVRSSNVTSTKMMMSTISSNRSYESGFQRSSVDKHTETVLYGEETAQELPLCPTPLVLEGVIYRLYRYSLSNFSQQ